MKKSALTVVLSAVLLLLASCALASGTQNEGGLSSSEMKDIQKYYMASYYAADGGTPSGLASARALTPFETAASAGAKATVPADSLSTTSFDTLSRNGSNKLSNYPEIGQTSVFTVSSTGTASVYDIKVTTSFSDTDSRESYVEEYYIKDGNSDGKWTTADYIVDSSGSTDSSARVQMVLTYKNGTVIKEKIVKVYESTGSSFISASSIAYSKSLESRDSSNLSAPAVSAAAGSEMYSSVVVYIQTPGKDSSYFAGWKRKSGARIIGVRYYTEYADTANSQYVGLSESREKTVFDNNTYTLDSPDDIITALYNTSLKTSVSESMLRRKATYTLATNSSGYYCAGSATGSVHQHMRSRIADFRNNYDYIIDQNDSDFFSFFKIIESILASLFNAWA